MDSERTHGQDLQDVMHKTYHDICVNFCLIKILKVTIIKYLIRCYYCFFQRSCICNFNEALGDGKHC